MASLADSTHMFPTPPPPALLLSLPEEGEVRKEEEVAEVPEVARAAALLLGTPGKVAWAACA